MGAQKQSIVITGAAGFIGSTIASKLLQTGVTVIGIDNFDPYYNPVIKKGRIRKLRKNDTFVFVNTSVTDRKKINDIVRRFKPSKLLHLAACVGVRNGELNPLKYYETNALGTQIILEECIKTISSAIIFSSSSVYGKTSPPFKETVPIQTTTPLSVYGVSKAFLEAISYNIYKSSKIPITVVRPFSIYGPNGRPDMLPIKLMIHAVRKTPLILNGTNANKRDWTYIDDFLDMFMPLFHKPKGYQIINIGSARPIGLYDFISTAKTVLKQYDVQLKTIMNKASTIETPVTSAETSLIHHISGHKPITPLRVGLENTARFFFNHTNLYV